MLPLLSLCLAAQIAFPMSSTQHRNLCKWEADIVRESSKNNIEPELLAALIYVESAYWPSSVSYANACGLTQVVPKWTGGKETRGIKYTCEQLKNPRTAIKVGAQESFHTILECMRKVIQTKACASTTPALSV